MVGYTPDEIETYKRGLSRKLGEGKTVSGIGILHDGSVQYAFTDPNAAMDSCLIRTGKPIYFSETMCREDVKSIIREQSKLEMQQARSQEILQNPEKALMKFGYRLFGAVPISVVKKGRNYIIDIQSGVSSIKIDVDEAARIVREYLQKQEKIIAMDVLLGTYGIFHVNTDALYRAIVGLEELNNAERQLKDAFSTYTNGVKESDTPDSITHAAGEFSVDGKGRVSLDIELPTIDEKPIRPTDKETIDRRNVGNWRTFENLKRTLLEE